MIKNKGHNVCINMRLKSADLKRLKEVKNETHDSTSSVISSAIECGYDLTASYRRHINRGKNGNK
jgi:methylphosphotriester-DNA--protein-cysteine methyltransferase